MRHLRDTKIIVTCNPSFYEGDFRLWESFLSGALVFIDEMVIQNWMPNPPIHGVHWISYDPTNRTDFTTKLHYYATHLQEAREIALAGYQHTLMYHMPTNRVEYILEHVKHKLTKLDDPSKRTALGLSPLLSEAKGESIGKRT